MPNNATPWVYRHTDTQRPCKVCHRMLPIAKFPFISGTPPPTGGQYRSRACEHCRGQEKPASPRPSPRKNSRGEWRCGICQEYLHADAFPKRIRGGQRLPYDYCWVCNRENDRLSYQIRKRDPAWRESERVRKRTSASKHKARKRREQAEICHVAVTWLLDHDWGAMAIQRATGVHRRTLGRIRRRESVRYTAPMVEHLTTLYQHELARLHPVEFEEAA